MLLVWTLARQMAANALLSFALLFVTVLSSQLLRLGPLVLAGLSDPLGFLNVLLDTLPRILAMALPFSLPLGAFLTVDRLERRSLGDAIRALGMPATRVWLRAGWLAGLGGALLVVPLAWLLEAEAAKAFPHHALTLAQESVIERIQPGQVVPMTDELSFYAGPRNQSGHFEHLTVLFEENVLTGRDGRLEGLGTQALGLYLGEAELWQSTAQGPVRTVAREVHVRLPVSRNIIRNMSFFADRERLSLAQLIQSPGTDREGRRRQHLGWTRLLAPLFTLILPVFSISCALLSPPRLRILGGLAATVLVIGVHLASESLTLAGWPAPLVAFLAPSIAVIPILFALRAEERRGLQV